MNTKKLIKNIIEFDIDKKENTYGTKNIEHDIKRLLKQQQELSNLINNFLKFIQQIKSESDIINNLLEKSALNIVTMSEELVNLSDKIQDTELSTKIQDKIFQIISSLEFQDIINQKFDQLKEFNDIITKKYNDFIEKYNISNKKLKKIHKEKEKEQIKEKEKEILTDQDLVDQLLAEFGIKQ